MVVAPNQGREGKVRLSKINRELGSLVFILNKYKIVLYCLLSFLMGFVLGLGVYCSFFFLIFILRL